MTQQQDVVAAKAQLASLKELHMTAIRAYTNCPSKSNDEAKEAALEIQRRGTAYFNYAEEFVGNSDLLGAHSSDLWAQGFAEDCVEILGSMPDHYQLLSIAFGNVPELRGLATTPGPTAYANMQRMVVLYLDGKTSKDLKKKFSTAGLPTYGFDNEVTRKSSSKQKTILSYAFGVIFVVAILIITLAIPEPSRFQRAVFWAILSMSLAGVASVITGFIEVKLGKWLIAGGALAVFAVVYFFVPADPLQASNPAAAEVIKEQRPASSPN